MKHPLLSRRARDFLQAAVLFALALFLNSGALALRTQEHLADKIIRLHVLANSDSPEDQAIKLQVRDAVFVRAGEIVRDVSSREEAAERLREHLSELRGTAEAVALRNGCTFPVTAEVCETNFPTKTYDGFALPTGTYLSLRVVIGQGTGQNWWCVIFPPLCAAVSGNAGETVTETAVRNGFSAEEIRLVTEENTGYVIKFKIVELWDGLRRAVNESVKSK